MACGLQSVHKVGDQALRPHALIIAGPNSSFASFLIILRTSRSLRSNCVCRFTAELSWNSECVSLSSVGPRSTIAAFPLARAKRGPPVAWRRDNWNHMTSTRSARRRRVVLGTNRPRTARGVAWKRTWSSVRRNTRGSACGRADSSSNTRPHNARSDASRACGKRRGRADSPKHRSGRFFLAPLWPE